MSPARTKVPANGLTSGGRPDDRRSTSGFSVNGQDDTLNNYVIDGIDDNERVIGTIGVKPNVEGIQEITVQTNSYAAEAGRTAGGVVNIVTRSGTNQFHGTVYEFFRNDIFDARSVFQTTGRKPELRQNQYGGSFGGPIFKNRTFFFGDYEGYRQVAGVTYRSTVPTIDEYNNIHSIGGGSPAALVAAGAGTQGRPIDPIALNYLLLFPAPNSDGLSNNYTVSPNRTQYSNIFDVRIDHKFNEKNLFFARYSYNKVDTNTPQALGTANGLAVSGGRYIFAGPATDTGQQYAFSFTHIINQNLLVDLKAAFTRVNNLSLPLNYGTNPDTKLGFGSNMNFNALSSFLTPIQFGPFSDVGDGAYVPLQDIDNTFQYAGTVSYTIGNHNIKAGASFIRRQARNVQSAFAAGQYTFGLPSDNAFDPQGNADLKKTQDNNLASSLVGAFSAASRNYDLNPPDYRSYEPSGFVQDSWKIRPNLTLVAGIRYDVFTPFTEAHNRISNFDFLQASGSTAATVASALKIANVGGVDGHAGIQTDYSNVAPRVGFSASINPTTVLRGGYGLSFFPGNYTSNADLKNAPFVSVYSPNCQSSAAVQIEGPKIAAGQNPDCATIPGASTTFDQGLPLPAAQTINSNALSFVAEDPHFRSAIIQQFNLQVEKQVGANVITVGYVGNIGQHLPEEINDINVPKPFDPSTGSSARPLATRLSNLGTVNWLQSEGISNYNALQTSFQRRFTKGLAFDANYTFAKALSDITGFSEEGQQGWSNADPTKINLIEYGIAENNIKSRFALSLNYEFQYGKGFTGLKKQVLGRLAGQHDRGMAERQALLASSTAAAAMTSPQPPHPTAWSTPSRTATARPPVNNGGSDRPNQIANPRLSNKTLNAVLQHRSLRSSTPRNHRDLAAQLAVGSNLSPRRPFPLQRLSHHGTSPTVEFRAECFDISNTPNFYINNNSGNSSTQFGNAAFGTVAQDGPELCAARVPVRRQAEVLTRSLNQTSRRSQQLLRPAALLC